MPSLFTPSGQDSISSLLSWSASADAGGVNGPRATLFFPILPASLLFGNPKIHRVQQRSNGRLPEAERGGAISGRLGNPSLALVPSNIQPTDTTSQTAPSSVLSIAKDGSSPHRMLHNAEGNAPTGCGAAVLCDHSAKSVKSGSCSRLQCTSCNWFGLLQQGGEVGWIIEGSLGGGGGRERGWRGCIPGAGNPPRHRLRHPPRISAISRFAGRLTVTVRAISGERGNLFIQTRRTRPARGARSGRVFALISLSLISLVDMIQLQPLQPPWMRLVERKSQFTILRFSAGSSSSGQDTKAPRH
jgi:hypothetical protein